MANVTSNAGKLSKEYRRRANQLSPAIGKGLKNAAIAVDNEQVELLSGGGDVSPGAYPIPIRTAGGLRSGHFFSVKNSRLAIVGNTADYAEAVHEGKGSNKVHGRRPFLDDAAEGVDTSAHVQKEMRKVMAIR